MIGSLSTPATRKTDRIEKFSEYARAAVQEYWLADPERQCVEVYTLKEGAYQLLERYVPGQPACLDLLLGFEVPADEIFKRIN